MTFSRFSQLWDALVTNRPKAANPMSAKGGMRKETADALIAYGKGDKRKIESIRKKLDS